MDAASSENPIIRGIYMAVLRTKQETSRSLRRAVVAILGTALLGTSALAGAQSTKEQQLEARVVELERLVQQLLAEKKAAPAPAAAGATGAAAPKPDSKVVQAGSITPNAAPGTSFLFTGFARVDGLWTDTPDGEIPEATSGRDYYVPSSIPIGGVDEGTDFVAHAKQSRMIFGTDTALDGGDVVSTRFEMDFFGSSLGDQRVTNTYAPVLRQAYVQWREWLAGQAWSNFQDVATLPDTLDLVGPSDGTVFVRQPQMRFTKGGFSASLENPETTITPYVGTLPPTSTGNDRITTDDSEVPDLTARYTWKGSWGHFSIAGLARELKYEQPSASISASTWTAAGSLSGKFMLGQDDIRYMLLGGNLGRYVGLNFANDAVLTPDGDLESIDGYAGFVAYRHVWNDRLRSNLYYAMQEYDNEVNLTGDRINKSSNSWTVNFIYSPLPKLDIGAEFRHAVRELENGADGSLDRLQFTTKYSF
jgi:hypothetical protein